jgi:hypothetical protein
VDKDGYTLLHLSCCANQSDILAEGQPLKDSVAADGDSNVSGVDEESKICIEADDADLQLRWAVTTVSLVESCPFRMEKNTPCILFVRLFGNQRNQVYSYSRRKRIVMLK